MKRLLVLAGVALLAAVAAVVGNSSRHAAGADTPMTFQQLAAACAASVDSNGFGSVTTSRDISILNESGDLPTPCMVHLSNRAGITIANSQVTTRNLYITDDWAGTQGATIQIEHSTLTGTGQSGLFVRMRHAADRVSIESSTVDYPLSVWMVVVGQGSGTDAGGGTIQAIHSSFKSVDAQSQGIRLMAASTDGSGDFVNDTFQTSYSFGQALLLAGTCHERDVQGAPSVCSLPPH